MLCDLAHFAVLLRQQARRTEIPLVVGKDPATAAQAFIARNPDSAEAQLLTRFVEAVNVRSGTFREAEVYVLGNEGLAIAVALLETSLQGW